MNWVSRLLALLLLSVWAVASVHCKLEVLPGMDFLKFCHADDAPAAPHAPCEDDGCAEVEDGNYRPEEQAASVPAPDLSMSPSLVALTPVEAVPRPSPAFGSESPPHLIRSWQFLARTALPPRAPSRPV